MAGKPTHDDTGRVGWAPPTESGESAAQATGRDNKENGGRCPPYRNLPIHDDTSRVGWAPPTGMADRWAVPTLRVASGSLYFPFHSGNNPGVQGAPASSSASFNRRRPV